MDKKTKKDLSGKHWLGILVDELIENGKEPYVITGGMTTSGPPHLGTLCEFLYPAMIKQILDSRKISSEYYFVGDILDAFDSIPFELSKYIDILEPELGKPLVYTKDPFNCHASLGEHYLSQSQQLMKELSLNINIVKADALYTEGKFDLYAILYLKNEQKVKEIVARTSMKKIEELSEWSPIMPICQKCGKIATTRVTGHTDDEYEYTCDKYVEYTKGCAYKGKNKIADHKYKLQWRLHWPSWQALFNTSIEGSGVDHMTKGGSATTAYAVHKELLNREPPIYFKYGFVLINGKKYSKSKGVGMGALEISKLIPPEILKYALVEPNAQQDKDINPNGDKLILLYDEVERVSKLDSAHSRADQKKLLAFNVSIGKLPWKAPFVDILLNYQIYRNWDIVGKMLNDKEGVSYLSKYIEEWLKRGYEPERYNFSVHETKISELRDIVKTFNNSLKEGMKDIDVHNRVYETAKENNTEPEQLFAAIYKALIGKDNGPRMGKLITSIGIKKTKQMLDFAIS